MKPDLDHAGPSTRATRWAAWAALKETGRQFRLSWIAIPVGVKGRCAATLAAGFVLCAILTAGITLLAKWRAGKGLDAWDEQALRGLVASDVLSVQQAIIAESFGNMAYMIPLTAACALVAARRRRPLLAIGFVASYVLARGIVWVGWLLWHRGRPNFILNGEAAPGLHSFPSGHVVLVLSVYGILAYLWARASRSWAERALAGVLLVALTALTATARVRLGAHWPSDVIAGFVIGLAWLAVVLRALSRAGHA